MRAVVLSCALGGVLAGCYQPDGSIESCTLTCDLNSGACPDGLVCDNGRCAEPSQTCGTTVGCIQTELLGEVCPDPGAADALNLTAMVDTTECTAPYESRMLNGIEVCLAFANRISVVGLRATGDKPLAIISTSTVSINNRLDASSYLLEAGRGAGSARDCELSGIVGNGAAGTVGAGPQGNGGGGGGGGSLQGAGGAGGTGEMGTSMAVGGPGGLSQTLGMRGGCAGGPGGGTAVTASGSGSGGFGGGIVYVVAGMAISLEDAPRIVAGGSGGAPGESEAGGGGGGGSGGALIFESPRLVAVGGMPTICANGGGGGGGGSASMIGGPGRNGCEDGISPAAPGSSEASDPQGNGGVGSSLANVNGTDGVSSADGGGGGAGGAGFILTFRVPAADVMALGATISPMIKVVP